MDTLFTYQHLLKAYQDCRRHKTNSINHLLFAEHLEQHIIELESELINRTYKPGRSIAFIVTAPKVREIFAADFRDRVVHHLLYNFIAPYFERQFIYDSWACRPQKGTHGAVRRVQGFMHKIKRLETMRHYYLQMDIRSFFTSIDKTLLYNMLAKKIHNKEVLWLAGVIIFHDCARDIAPKLQSNPKLFKQLPPDKSLFRVPSGVGLPIGNLTSQFFANIYLNELDQFVKHHLKAKYYCRYVDDFVILGENKDTLDQYRHQICTFLMERLNLQAHPKKQIIQSIGSGMDFLGYIIRPQYILVRRRVVGQWRRKMELYAANPNKGRAVLASYQAHASWANAHSLTKHNDTIWQNLLADNGEMDSR